MPRRKSVFCDQLLEALLGDPGRSLSATEFNFHEQSLRSECVNVPNRSAQSRGHYCGPENPRLGLNWWKVFGVGFFAVAQERQVVFALNGRDFRIGCESRLAN